MSANAPTANTRSANSQRFDTILVGGGLQSGLIAAALRHTDPDHRILLVERDQQIGGNHTWSFHRSDIDPSFLPAIEPLIETQWSGYSIRVGRTRRSISLPYASISSSYFADAIRDLIEQNPDSRLMTDAVVDDVHPDSIRLKDGRVFDADVVIDSRGPDAQSRESFQGGYQKFWGFEFEFELDVDWPDGNPIVMDDDVDQSDGFRFFYVLPFTPRRVMIEDTRFSNTTDLDRGECLRQVESYLNRHGIAKGRIVREEQGVLPMPIDHHHRPAVDADPSQAIRGGYAGGWFHAATGYSFPMAATFAQKIASVPRSPQRDQRIRESLSALADRHSFQATFGRFLNRLLFKLVRPNSRYQIFQRFYKVLSEERIARFYSHQFNRSDAARIVIGMPPTGLQPIRFLRSFRKPIDSTQVPTAVRSTTALHEVSA